MAFLPKRNLRRPKPPGRLSREAKGWWKRITEAFPLEDASLLILESGLECFDTMRQAQETIRKSGTVVADRFGCPRMHPAVLIERDAKSVRCCGTSRRCRSTWSLYAMPLAVPLEPNWSNYAHKSKTTAI